MWMTSSATCSFPVNCSCCSSHQIEMNEPLETVGDPLKAVNSHDEVEIGQADRVLGLHLSSLKPQKHHEM